MPFFFHPLFETFLSRQRKRLSEDGIEEIDWNLFGGIFSAASGEVVAEDALSESLKTLEVQKIFPDGTIGRKITTADLRAFLTSFGDDPLTDAEAQELIQVDMAKMEDFFIILAKNSKFSPKNRNLDLTSISSTLWIPQKSNFGQE